MPDETLHLVKIPLRANELATLARRRRLSSELDDGYLAHCVLRELWQEMAPQPFELRRNGRSIEVWGYVRSGARGLIDHARTFGDPSLVKAIDDIEGIAAKAMPRIPVGRRVGFLLRACPIVRLSKGREGHEEGAEIDAFLARCFAVGRDQVVEREAVYREWLGRQCTKERTGARLDRVSVAGYARERFIRRTQGADRRAHRLERPDVRFEGDFTVEDSDLFLRFLSHGVGRHRAFGFGAVMLVPPGTSYSAR